MNFKFTTRDFKIFLLGVFGAFLFAVIYDWKDVKQSFLDGYEDGYNAYGQKQQDDKQK